MEVRSAKLITGFVVSLVLTTANIADTNTDTNTDTDTDSRLWAALKAGGYIAIMRHALAPGTGDPDNFQLHDCSTQRNLSETGRNQAKHIGHAFRQRNISIDKILSSRWCRCLETARLLNLGPVTPWPVLDSFFQRWENRDSQTAALKAFIEQQKPMNTNLILVTHQVNISALTDVYTDSGEIVIIRPLSDKKGFHLVGSLTLDLN